MKSIEKIQTEFFERISEKQKDAVLYWILEN
jgi:hypothetical protein